MIGDLHRRKRYARSRKELRRERGKEEPLSSKDIQPRYDIREEEDGTWTVYDRRPAQDREPRIIYGVIEKRARQYLQRMNATAGISEKDVERDD